jgi:5-methylcytosine-specific restriction endonuclease McrA
LNWLVKQARQLRRVIIILRDGARCQYCSKPLTYNQLTLDHVLPKSRGGGDELGNLVTCCERCNSFKANRTPAEAGLMWGGISEKAR